MVWRKNFWKNFQNLFCLFRIVLWTSGFKKQCLNIRSTAKHTSWETLAPPRPCPKMLLSFRLQTLCMKLERAFIWVVSLPGSMLSSSWARMYVPSHAELEGKWSLSKWTGGWGKGQFPYISFSFWYGPGFISAYWLGFCKHDRAPIVLYPISPTCALVIKLYANHHSQTLQSRETIIGL